MNKLLLLSLLGFALIALSGASEENGENSLKEAESAIDEFEMGELADAEAKRRTRKNKGKKNKARKNKKGKGNKNKKGAGKKNKSKKQNGRKNKNRKGGKKNRKNKGKRNNKRKNKGKRNNKKNKGKGLQRNGTCDLTCLDAGIKIMKTIKDKITNYKRQSIRVAKQGKIGKGKQEKKGAFKQALDDLIDAGGGNKAKLMCSGNATNDGAKQMLNLTTTLSNCSDTIKLKCGNESFPTPPDPAVVEKCLENMGKFTNMSLVCLNKTGAEACACWINPDFLTIGLAIQNCSLSEYANKVAKAKTTCVKAFGKCRKYEDAVGKQIHMCNQDSGKLTKKLGAAKANSDALGAIKTMTEALINNLSGKRNNRGRRAIASCADFTKASSDLIASITENPTQDSAAVAAKIAELKAFTGAGCSASDLAALKSVVAAADAGIAAVAKVLEKLQAAFAALTGAPLSDDALAAAGASAAAGGDGGAGGSTSGRMMRRLSIKNVLRNVAKYV